MKLGFIGTGDITKAIVTGLMSADYPLDEIILSPRNAQVSARLAADHPKVVVASDNQQVVDGADLVFLAVRPQVAEKVIRALKFPADKQIVSLIATVTQETLQEWTGTSQPIPRAVPLPAVSDRQGATVIYPADGKLQELFGTLGPVIEATTLDELDALTTSGAVMGLYFGLQETIVAWLAERGISDRDARTFIGKVFLELGRTAAREPEKDFITLREEHSTEGGINEQMFRTFTEQGGTEALNIALNSVAGRILSGRG
ncbi:pyrroline-5-carboxylate reductase [Paracoccus albus]|uniref:pyrroline-5-carboxylate reductase n=1 Tax=Paracoccus albus TaxID=3017784 RepID=UPI0022F0DC3D|nr:pyrroline-5-carboxylate reductase [Paracoccus albus]WBU58843.1 pyrroline-5-carboxylate reductase [Paracoccus albus]